MNFLKLLVWLPFLVPALALAQNYQIDWHVIASGGGHSESAEYQIDATIGQPVVGQSSSESYTLKAGYWVGFLARGDCVYLPGDCNHNSIPLELGDVVAMVGMYRGSVAPYYICDCGVDPPGAQFAATADPNGNCVAFELGDVVTEIGAYRGSTTAFGCVDCPGWLRFIPDGDRPLVMPGLKGKAVRKVSQ
jgi:hypothetical protein